MKVLGVLVFLVTIAGNLISAEEAVGFAENVRGSRIVSGWEAEEGQIKWQLSIRMVAAGGGVSACGASIVHNEWAITAAHCTAQRTTIVIRGGVIHLTRPELLFETTEYYNHPIYDESRPGVVQPNDIGLLKFNRFIPFSDLIQPINVQLSADKDRNYNGARLMASGWGRTWTNGPSPQTLNWVYLVGDSNIACFVYYGGNSIIQDSTICASAYNVSSQSTCQGDSGGPLVAFEVDGGPTLVGVASFVSGSGCHVNLPAGFIRPGHYHEWFYEVTGIDFDKRRPPPTTTEAPTTTPEPIPEPPSSESSETDSGSSEAVSGSSEADSGSSEGNGGSSEGDGGSSEGNGGSSEGDGGSSEGNGGSSEGDAGSSEGNGGSSEGDGGSSEGDGGSSEGDGGSSEGDGGSSEGDGGSSEGNGGSSEGNGGSSEGDGGSSEGDGGSSEGNGGSSEGNDGSSEADTGSSEGNGGSSAADSGSKSDNDSEADSESKDNDDPTSRDGFWR